MPSRCCTQYVSKSGRSSIGHKTGKGETSSQFPSRVVVKNVLTIRQVLSSPMLVRSCLKSCMLGLSIMWTKNFQMSKLGLEKKEEPEIKLLTFEGLYRKSKGISEKHLSLFHWLLQSLWLCRSWQTVDSSYRDGNTRPSYLSPETSVCGSRSNS